VRELKTKYRGFPQQKFIPLQTPTYALLCGDELKIIDQTIAKLSNMSATQVSAYSHQDMPWKSANNSEVLDYEMVFYRDDVMSVREEKDDNIQ